MKTTEDLDNGFKLTELGPLPDEWQVKVLTECFEFSKKPRSLRIEANETIPFIPMELICDDRDRVLGWQDKLLSEITSGTFVFKNDLLIAKITPSFENGKQAILKDIPKDFAYATTEVWALHPTSGELSVELISNYLRIPELRRSLSHKMEGATGRQRLPRNVLEDLIIPIPPSPEQQKIAAVLSTVQEAKAKVEAVINAAKELKRSMMKHLFTYGAVPIEEAEKVVLRESYSGKCPARWSFGRFDEFLVLQRGFDITKSEQRDGNIPVVSSGGTLSFHNAAKVSGPGVIIGRKGSLGTVYFIVSDYWPHDTTLWVKDFKGNDPKFVYYFLSTLRLKQLDSGTSNPTLNRNYVHALKVGFPDLAEQQGIAKILSTIDNKISIEEKKNKAIAVLFKTLLSLLMRGEVRVKDLEIPT